AGLVGSPPSLLNEPDKIVMSVPSANPSLLKSRKLWANATWATFSPVLWTKARGWFQAGGPGWLANVITFVAVLIAVMYFSCSLVAPAPMIIGWPTTNPARLLTVTWLVPAAWFALSVSHPWPSRGCGSTLGAGALPPLIQVSCEFGTVSPSSSNVSEHGVGSATAPMQMV